MANETGALQHELKLVHPWFDYSRSFLDNATPWAGHKYFAYNLVSNLQPGLIVELGSWKGTSFYSFCQAVKDTKGSTKLVAIDTWEGDKHSGYYDDRILNEFKNILTLYYPTVQATYIRKTFSDALPEFQDETIDLLHIDGLHTYEAVSQDFYTWLPKVKKDGIILFHDITQEKDDFGVWKLWAELKLKYPYTLEFSHSNGLGILIFDKRKYDLLNSNFTATKLSCLQYSYENVKAELFEGNYSIKELKDIKNSRFWHLKESLKKILFMSK